MNAKRRGLMSKAKPVPIELRNPELGSPAHGRLMRAGAHEGMRRKLGRAPTATERRIAWMKARRDIVLARVRHGVETIG